MARKPAKTLTERELEIMHVLWSLGQARLGEIQEALNKSGDSVAPSTVATQLNLLINKGYVTQSGRLGRSLYSPICTHEEATRNLFDDFRTRVGLGRTPAFLIQLLRDEHLTDADRAALKDLLRESETESADKPPSQEK